LKLSSSTPAYDGESRPFHVQPYPSGDPGNASPPRTIPPAIRFTPRAASESAIARSGSIASPAMWSLTVGSPLPVTTRSPRSTPSPSTVPVDENVVT
jgi:hypothetical protein